MAKKNQYEDEEYHFIPRETQREAAKSAQAKTIQDQANYWDTVAYNQTKPVGTNPSPLYDALSGMANYWEGQAYNATKPLESQRKPDPDTTPDYYGGGGGGSTQTAATTAEWDPQLPSFSYEDAPEFVSRYQGLIDEYLNGVLNRPAFSYNYEDDPLYQQYAKSYGDAGRRAMQDTLAQVSARTGGIASSYAGSASQQAYNQYMARLADKVPELQQLAYSMYNDELDRDAQRLSALRGLEGDDYGRYTDQLGQYNTDRSFAYGLNRDAVSDARYADELLWDRAAAAAALGDYSGYKSLGVNTSLAEAKARGGSGSGGTSKSAALNRYLTYLEMGGDPNSFDPALLEATGLTPEELSAYASYYAAGGDAGYTGIDTDEALKLLKSGNTDIINSPQLQNWLENYLGITPETQPTVSDNPVVSNNHGESWVQVSGYGRVSWQELQNLVDSGKVKETFTNDGNKVTYTKVR